MMCWAFANIFDHNAINYTNVTSNGQNEIPLIVLALSQSLSALVEKTLYSLDGKTVI